MSKSLLTLCVCNIGVQECLVHPGRLRTQEEKIAFRKEFDTQVDNAATRQTFKEKN